jgi:hypothetical protein
LSLLRASRIDIAIRYLLASNDGSRYGLAGSGLLLDRVYRSRIARPTLSSVVIEERSKPIGPEAASVGPSIALASSLSVLIGNRVDKRYTEFLGGRNLGNNSLRKGEFPAPIDSSYPIYVAVGIS